MSTDLRFKVLGGMLLLVLLVSAVLTTPALADGGAPPPSSPSTASTTGGVKLPSGTRLVVLEGGGHKVPLGSQIAAQAIASSDPVWCPATVATPTPGAYGCTSPGPGNVNYDPTRLDSLVNYLSAHQKTVNGTIWITGGPDGSLGTITLDGSVGFTTMSLYALTLKGGWTGTSAGHIDPATPSLFDQWIEIVNWKNNVTLTDIQTNGTAVGKGLFVATTKNIVLTRVQANSNAGFGATLDNTSGNGLIKITLGVFTSNINYGVLALSNGAIKLVNVEASGNGGSGAMIDNSTGTAGVTLGGTNLFNGNLGSYGLQVMTKGAIAINTVTAGSNTNGTGAELLNLMAGSPKPVTITGSAAFSSNKMDGLYVASDGPIAINNLVSVSNTNGDGVYLDNTSADTAQPITLTGFNYFIGNGSDGLTAYSRGAILMSNVTAVTSVAGDGARLVNNFGGSTAGVTLTGSNIFATNGSDGLVVNSNGAIRVSNLTSSYNAGGIGASLDNSTALSAKPVTLAGFATFRNNSLNGLVIASRGLITAKDLTVELNDTSMTANIPGAKLDNSLGTAGVTFTGTNIFKGNQNIGLVVTSRGAILLNNVVADSNGGFGANLDNSGSSGFPGVTLTGANEFKYNFGDGLNILSRGAISVRSVTAKNNCGDGVNLDNTISGTDHPKTVTLSGASVFNNNWYTGLSVTTYGAITASNLTALMDGAMGLYDGVDLSNFNAVTPASVTLSGVNVFNGNNKTGLVIQSKGAINVHSVTANDSLNGMGGELTNSYAGAVGGVVVSGTNVFNDDDDYGLMISTRGAVSLSNLTANDSKTGYGVEVSATAGGTSAPKPITLTGTNMFNGNAIDGLHLETYGAISVRNVTANGNGTMGMHLYNAGAATPANVTVSGINMFNVNTSSGLNIQSKGSVSVARITSDGNIVDGLVVNATSPTSKITVTCGSFLYNTGNGLNLTAGTTITLIGVVTHGNGADILATPAPNYVRTCTLP